MILHPIRCLTCLAGAVSAANRSESAVALGPGEYLERDVDKHAEQWQPYPAQATSVECDVDFPATLNVALLRLRGFGLTTI